MLTDSHKPTCKVRQQFQSFPVGKALTIKELNWETLHGEQLSLANDCACVTVIKRILN